MEKSFGSTLFSCIDKALSSILGRLAIESFYYLIDTNYGLPKSKFPEKPLELIEHLKKILGPLAFRAIERVMVTEIKEAFEIEDGETELLKVIETAQRKYVQDSS